MQAVFAYGVHGLGASQALGFNQIHRVCDTRIREQLCPTISAAPWGSLPSCGPIANRPCTGFHATCERIVKHSEIVRGYEIDNNRWVEVEDEEIKKIEPRSTTTMEIIGGDRDGSACTSASTWW
jgi:hypothetical protein